jgi:hypothetical protein
MINLLAILMEDEAQRADFMEEDGGAIILDMVLRVASAGMPRLLDCLRQAIGMQQLKLCTAHVAKLAPYLLSTDLGARQQALQVIDQLIDRECYEDQGVFTALVENLMKNATPETRQVLGPTLAVLKRLAAFPLVRAQLRVVDAGDRLCPLLKLEDESLVNTALQLLETLFDGTQPKQRTVSTFLSNFAPLVARTSTDCHLELLNALTMLMGYDICSRKQQCAERWRPGSRSVWRARRCW